MSHTNLINDRDPYFEIDPITRAVKNMSATKTTVIQYDHNSERLSFSIPRYIEDHDMMECDKIEVHYINGTTKGLYIVEDAAVDTEDENKVNFSWLLSQKATQTVGAIQFLIRFSCLADDGTIEYAWNTGIYSGLLVSAGMYNTDDVVDQHADVLEQWNSAFSSRMDKVEYTQNNTARTLVSMQSDIESKTRTHIFDTVEKLDEYLDLNADLVGAITTGDIFIVKDENSPDYWWDGTQKQPFKITKDYITANFAALKNSGGGFEGGENAKVGDNHNNPGAASGRAAFANWGFAGGCESHTNGGASAGYCSYSYDGGAVGKGASTGNGFAGGMSAKAQDANGNGIDAVQLGTGTNHVKKTLQVYDYQLMKADGKIPLARLAELYELMNRTYMSAEYIIANYYTKTAVEALIDEKIAAALQGA